MISHVLTSPPHEMREKQDGHRWRSQYSAEPEPSGDFVEIGGAWGNKALPREAACEESARADVPSRGGVGSGEAETSFVSAVFKASY